MKETIYFSTFPSWKVRKTNFISLPAFYLIMFLVIMWLGIIHILRNHILGIFGPPLRQLSMFLVLRISKNWHFLNPPYKCWRNIWMVPNFLGNFEDLFFCHLNWRNINMFAYIFFKSHLLGVFISLFAWFPQILAVNIDLWNCEQL